MSLDIVGLQVIVALTVGTGCGTLGIAVLIFLVLFVGILLSGQVDILDLLELLDEFVVSAADGILVLFIQFAPDLLNQVIDGVETVSDLIADGDTGVLSLLIVVSLLVSLDLIHQLVDSLGNLVELSGTTICVGSIDGQHGLPVLLAFLGQCVGNLALHGVDASGELLGLSLGLGVVSGHAVDEVVELLHALVDRAELFPHLIVVVKGSRRIAIVLLDGGLQVLAGLGEVLVELHGRAVGVGLLSLLGELVDLVLEALVEFVVALLDGGVVVVLIGLLLDLFVSLVEHLLQVADGSDDGVVGLLILLSSLLSLLDLTDEVVDLLLDGSGLLLNAVAAVDLRIGDGVLHGVGEVVNLLLDVVLLRLQLLLVEELILHLNLVEVLLQGADSLLGGLDGLILGDGVLGDLEDGVGVGLEHAEQLVLLLDRLAFGISLFIGLVSQFDVLLDLGQELLSVLQQADIVLLAAESRLQQVHSLVVGGGGSVDGVLHLLVGVVVGVDGVDLV